MSLNDVASANRLHIGFFGMRNAGKSSIVNAVTSQNLSIVSDVMGTTTDPVRKSMELLPLGPVVVIDTPGYDDVGEVGDLRVRKTRAVLGETDVAVLIVDSVKGLSACDKELIVLFETADIPYIIAYNKYDLLQEPFALEKNEIFVSAKDGFHIDKLKELLGNYGKKFQNYKCLVSDLLQPGDYVILVIPIDEAAPKGRLIMPQQMVIRDILDTHCVAFSCQPEELKDLLQTLSKKPKLIITDSQAFESVAKDVPEDILLTSFSILMARYKGDLTALAEGAEVLGQLQNGDKILIAESCTHHRQCNDIGTVKLPNWIRRFSGVEPVFEFTSGREFPADVSDYRIIIHCGGCMINESAMQTRIKLAENNKVPMINYGIAIAKMNGILAKSLEPFL